MAFLKTARAVVQNPHVSRRAWGEIRTASRTTGKLPSFARTRVAKTGGVPANLVDQASTIFGTVFDPSNYLLTHATIVASVDTYSPVGVKLGSFMESGFRVNRKYGDYRIKAECAKFINNNKDSWSRGVLLKAFETFIGGHNFVEHVQIESMSKGRIIDAVARDIGDSVYIDILIATDRRHTDLVDAIKSGKMGTLSMGCVVDGTQCTKCGHWAADEPEMCADIKYAKGNTFFDEQGRQHIIAELCFPANTRVVLADGSRQAIGDIQIGDMVLTHTGQVQPVTQLHQSLFTGDLITLDVMGLPQTIKATPKHPFWVLSPNGTCACGCGTSLSTRKLSSRAEYTRKWAVGHHPNGKGVSSLEQPEFVFKRASDLRNGDMLALPVPTQMITPKDMNTNRARLLGWFLAEGCFVKKNGVKTGIQFTLNAADERPIADELAQLLVLEFEPEPRSDATRSQEKDTPVKAIADGYVRSLPRVCQYSRLSEPGEKLTVVYINRAAANWFYQNAGEYSAHKRLPEGAIHWPVDIQGTLLRAYVRGDGTVDRLNRFSVSSISETLISQMQIVAARCGLWARRLVMFDGKSVEMESVINGPSLPVGANGCRPCHTLAFQPSEATTDLFSWGDTGHVRGLAPAWRHHEGCLLYRVRGVGRESFHGQVHNLGVAGDNSYLVEGLAAHNCGHEDLNPTGGVTFSEASWVETPAFAGAVLRNVMEADADVSARVAKVLNTSPPQWSSTDQLKVAGMSRAATSLDVLEAAAAQDPRIVGRVNSGPLTSEDVLSVGSPFRWAADLFLAGWEDEEEEEGGGEEEEGGEEEGEEEEGEEEEGEEEAAPPEKEDSPLEDATSDLEKHLLTQVKKKIKDEIKDKDVDDALSTAPNNTLQHEATYKAGLNALVRTASSDAALVNEIAAFNKAAGVRIPVPIYRAALKLGASENFSNSQGFVRACRAILGRQPKTAEVRVLARLSALLTRRAQACAGNHSRSVK